MGKNERRPNDLPPGGPTARRTRGDPDRTGPWSPRHWPLNKLLIHVLPWPEGKAKGPKESFTTSKTDWQNDVGQLEELLARMAEKAPGEKWPVHPLFGNMSGYDWGVLTYRHFDHHLRQFGA